MSQSAASSPCTHHTTNEFASLTDNKLDNETVQRLDSESRPWTETAKVQITSQTPSV